MHLFSMVKTRILNMSSLCKTFSGRSYRVFSKWSFTFSTRVRLKTIENATLYSDLSKFKTIFPKKNISIFSFFTRRDFPLNSRVLLSANLAKYIYQALGAWSLYIFAFRLYHKTSKGCYVYLSTHRPSVIDRFPRKATLFWHSWAECETKTSWWPRIIWKLECLIVPRISKTEYCDGEYR